MPENIVILGDELVEAARLKFIEAAKEYENGTINGEPANRSNAKERMKRAQGKTLTSKDGDEAALGINAINNILSGEKIKNSTKNKKFTTRQYLAIAADIENLFRNATRVLTRPDYKNVGNIKEVHNYVAPIFGDNVAYITVKESIIEGKKVYNIELLEIGEIEGKIRNAISKIALQTATISPKRNIEKIL